MKFKKFAFLLTEPCKHARWAHMHDNCTAKTSLQKVEDVTALLMFPISSPPLTIITESSLNCQIELSGGHLFNKHCLVYSNEMERMRVSFKKYIFLSGGGIFGN